MALWEKPESGATAGTTPPVPASGTSPRPAGTTPAASLYTQDTASAPKERMA